MITMKHNSLQVAFWIEDYNLLNKYFYIVALVFLLS